MTSFKWRLLLVVLALPGLLVASAQTALADYLDQGTALYNQHKFAEAARCLDAKLAQAPTDPFALYYAALCYHQLRNFEKAKSLYKKLVEVAPDSEMGQKAAIALKQFPQEKNKVPGVGKTAPMSVPTPSDASSDWASLPNTAKVYFEYDDRSGIMVEPTINGRTIRMIFDTGAPNTMIGKNQLEDAGIAPPTGPPAGKSGGAGNANLVDVWAFNADITLGTIKRKNVPITVLATNSTEPLLGQSFFRDYAFTVDKGAQALTFTKKGATVASSSEKPKDAYEVPYTFAQQYHRILVTVLVNGKPCEMIFDTGNAHSPVVFQSEKQLKDAGLTVPDDAEVTSTGGLTGQGTSKTFYVNRIKLGPIERFDCPVTASTGALEKPLLGQSFWEDWQYTIDSDRKVIRFVRR